MFDVYGLQSDPALRVVVPKGAKLPPHLVGQEWVLLGTSPHVAPDIAQTIVINGFFRYRSNVPFSDGQTLGEPDGRQRQ